MGCYSRANDVFSNSVFHKTVKVMIHNFYNNNQYILEFKKSNAQKNYFSLVS